MECEVKCGMECDSCRRNGLEKVWHRQRTMPTDGGIRGLPGFALYTLLLGFSLCVSLSGLVLKDAWPPYYQVLLHY